MLTDAAAAAALLPYGRAMSLPMLVYTEHYTHRIAGLSNTEIEKLVSIFSKNQNRAKSKMELAAVCLK